MLEPVAVAAAGVEEAAEEVVIAAVEAWLLHPWGLVACLLVECQN